MIRGKPDAPLPHGSLALRFTSVDEHPVLGRYVKSSFAQRWWEGCFSPRNKAQRIQQCA
jgi:hypothetical protein